MVGGILLLLAVVCIIVAGLLYRQRFLLRRQALLKLRPLQITLPRPQPNESQPRDPKELIGLMEAVFSTIQHYKQSGFWKELWHGQPTFSFELTAREGSLFFTALIPEQYVEQMTQQIHAQYPSAHIDVADTYDIFAQGTGEGTAAAALKLVKSPIFPIRTYKALENDPLSAITSSLSRVGEGSAAVQLIIQPSLGGWQKQIEKALQNVQKGDAFEHKSGVGHQVKATLGEIGKAALGKEAQDKENEAKNMVKPDVRLTALQEEQARYLVAKASKVALMVQVRIVARAATDAAAEASVQGILASFSQFATPDANAVASSNRNDRALLPEYIFRSMSRRQPTMLLNVEELASLYHFPNLPLDTPNVHWLGARSFPPPTNLPAQGVEVGKTAFRGEQKPVFLTYPDRMRHLYAIGKTGVGKTVLFQNMVLQDIRNGHGVCYIDPNGDAVEWILKHVPRERLEDVILIDPSDTARPLSLNLLEYDPQQPQQKTTVINEMLAIFDKLYDMRATGGPMFEQYMRNAMLLVMDNPEQQATLMEIPKVLADDAYRAQLLASCKNSVVVDFWTKEAEKAGGEAALANIVPYITSKLTQFTTNDLMRPIIGQGQSSFNFRTAMDERKIILVSLPKGLLGDLNAMLLGMIISGKIQIAAFSRQNQPEDERIPFFMYVDEFQNFTSKAFATILSEARKYRLSLNITHQYIEQLDDDMRAAVLGNVGTLIAWRVGVQDAEYLQKELAPASVDDLVSNETFTFYIRMLIDGAPAKPFNVRSNPPDAHEHAEHARYIKEFSRLTYGRDREAVEESIRQRGRNVLPSSTNQQS